MQQIYGLIMLTYFTTKCNRHKNSFYLAKKVCVKVKRIVITVPFLLLSRCWNETKNKFELCKSEAKMQWTNCSLGRETKIFIGDLDHEYGDLVIPEYLKTSMQLARQHSFTSDKSVNITQMLRTIEVRPHLFNNRRYFYHEFKQQEWKFKKILFLYKQNASRTNI